MDTEKQREERYQKNLLNDLKPLIPYIEQKDVTNIFVLSSGEVKVSALGKGSKYVDVNISVEQRMRIIFAIAAMSGIEINQKELPKLEGVIPLYNARFTAILPPWVQRPEFTIRRLPEQIYSLESYVESERMSKEQYEQICEAIKKRQNIIIGGATGSGKTTFLNAVLKKMAEYTPEERFLIIEDTPELSCPYAKDVTYACGRSSEVIEIVRLAMRWSMDRIIFGELRYGDVANELIKIWATGHTGNATTIHAGSAIEVFTRLNGLLREVILGELPQLSLSIQLCVHLIKGESGPKVNEVLDTSSSGIDEYTKLLKP